MEGDVATTGPAGSWVVRPPVTAQGRSHTVRRAIGAEEREQLRCWSTGPVRPPRLVVADAVRATDAPRHARPAPEALPA